jgi:hypothetical protein
MENIDNLMELERQVSNDKDIARFIAEKASASIGPGCVIGTSVIIFEFIGSDGRMGHGVLRQHGTDVDETLDLLVGATETIMGIQEKKFPYDEDYPDNL